MSLNTAHPKISLQLLPALSDNYIFVLYHNETKEALVVDPAESKQVVSFLKSEGLHCRWILNTHHHFDHIDGNSGIQNAFAELEIFAPQKNKHQIRNVKHWLAGSETLRLLGLDIQVLPVPGHTLGHLAYYVPEAKLLFSGDTLFLFGCGRLFEGTPEMMWTSLKSLRTLPDDTSVCCAHEYTLANLEFLCSLQPENLEIRQIYEQTKAQRQRGEPSVPALMKTQIRHNPFLRADCKDLQTSLGLTGASEVEVFTHIRKLKDQY